MNAYGVNLKLKIYGGSHDEKIGMILSGIPAGEVIDLDALRAFMARRAPGNDKFATARKEPDEPVFLSGLDGNVTNGEPIEAVIYNTNQRSGDYSSLSDIPRPSHADYAARVKYGEGVDLRGGGHFSGRLTAPMCIAGGICLQILAHRGIDRQKIIVVFDGHINNDISVFVTFPLPRLPRLRMIFQYFLLS